jgi:predicted amidohydrolase YtcJ
MLPWWFRAKRGLSNCGGRKTITVLVIALIFFSLRAPGARGSSEADLVVRNAHVYIGDASHSVVEAVAVRRGRILFTGKDSEVSSYIGTRTRVIDAHGNSVLPGFIDSHIHPISGGMLLSECNLHDLNEIDQMVREVRRCAQSNPRKKWITGAGWDMGVFPPDGPRKELLDSAAPDRPILLEALDGHSIWVNSRALQIAGITRHTPDPPGGRIERDAASGEPSGTLRESAMSLVARKAPKPSNQEYRTGLESAMRLANSYGITAITEANASPQLLRTYAAEERLHRLTVRVVASQHYDRAKGLDQIAGFLAAKGRWHSNWFECGQVKLFVDGVLESRTAALLEPYLGTRERGEPNYSPKQLNRIVTALDKNGLQAHFHAIGDRAVRMALDSIEVAEAQNGRKNVRHHIAHLELVNPIDIPRFAKLGVTANFQALWAFPDDDIRRLTYPVLGPIRSQWLYPIRSIVKTHARVVGGSDWSVTSMNPLEAIQVAITRRALDGTGEALNEDEGVDLPTMVAAYTIDGAWLRNQEDLIGSLQSGKLADFIVLDADLFSTPVAQIHSMRVLYTFVEGRQVYAHATAAQAQPQ